MRNLDEMLSTWAQRKRRVAGYKLGAPWAGEHEYQGAQVGHPSSYAFARFSCEPAQNLTFAFEAEWPSSLTPDYRELLEQAMGEAIVDVLIAGRERPYVGCLLKCADIKWDDIGSSEMAFYRATRAVVTALRDKATWSLMMPRR